MLFIKNWTIMFVKGEKVDYELTPSSKQDQKPHGFADPLTKLKAGWGGRGGGTCLRGREEKKIHRLNKKKVTLETLGSYRKTRGGGRANLLEVVLD